MKRKSVLSIFLILILGVPLLAGCGGGGSKQPPRLSTDYFGLEDGAILSYNFVVYDPDDHPVNSTGTMHMLVTLYQPGIYKVGYDIAGDIDGFFVEKDGNSYYDRGDWETDEDKPGERGGLLCTNPLPDNFSSNRWGTFQTKESITVPAGTFEAWKFWKHEENGDGSVTDLYIWFVPYLGEIKVSETDKQGSTVTYNGEFELASYSF